MKTLDIITELRSNPTLNLKSSPSEQLSKYVGKNYYVSYQKIPKIGINPRSRYVETPGAIYAYPLDIIWNDIKTDIRNVPWAGLGNYIFVISPTVPVLYIRSFSVSDYKKAKRRLYGFINSFRVEDPFTINPNYKPRDRIGGPFDGLLELTLKMAKSQRKGSEYKFIWNRLLKKATGYTAFLDDGTGQINQNEPSQIMFLEKSSLKIVDMINISNAPK